MFVLWNTWQVVQKGSNNHNTWSCIVHITHKHKRWMLTFAKWSYVYAYLFTISPCTERLLDENKWAPYTPFRFKLHMNIQATSYKTGLICLKWCPTRCMRAWYSKLIHAKKDRNGQASVEARYSQAQTQLYHPVGWTSPPLSFMATQNQNNVGSDIRIWKSYDEYTRIQEFWNAEVPKKLHQYHSQVAS